MIGKRIIGLPLSGVTFVVHSSDWYISICLLTTSIYNVCVCVSFIESNIQIYIQ